jgi:hypothetical protein
VLEICVDDRPPAAAAWCHGSCRWLLKKRSDVGGAWHRRWFTLSAEVLSRWDDNVDAVGTGSERGHILLKEVMEVRLSSNPKAKAYEIELVTKNRVQRLKTDNEFELNSWVAVLRKYSYTEDDTTGRLSDGVAGSLMQVICPPGSAGGSKIALDNGGSHFVVTIPPGVVPGQSFHVNLAPPPSPTPTRDRHATVESCGVSSEDEE